jgi:hypothetical protein
VDAYVLFDSARGPSVRSAREVRRCARMMPSANGTVTDHPIVRAIVGAWTNPALLREGSVMLMAEAATVWTLDELHRRPGDGNKYELVRGALFVTPPPSVYHETIGARPHRILEPDLMVWKPDAPGIAKCDGGPPPILVVEILSPYSRRRDREAKREFYIDDRKIGEYWIADPDDSTIPCTSRPR